MSNAARTILIPVTSNFFARNFLRTDAFAVLKDTPGIRIILLAPKGKIGYYRDTFGAENVFVDETPTVRGLRIEKFFQIVEQASIMTRRAHMDQVTALMRSDDQASALQAIPRLLLFLWKRAIRTLGHFGKLWRRSVRFLYLMIPSSHFSEVFARYRPTLVFAPTMVFSEDYVMLREATRQGIATMGMVFSWDTFYSKTFLRVHPDRLLVQTSYIKRQAVRLGDFPPDRITVTGISQYDAYFKGERLVSRDEFFRRIGADPRKRLILYAFSGKAGLGIDLDIVGIIAKLRDEGKIPRETGVLLRPYPRFDFSPEKLKHLSLKYRFLGEPSTSSIGTDRGEWEMDEEALSLLGNSLAHADVVITMYSTFFIEAAIFDRPLIGVAFDGSRTYNYWNSARRFFDWDHLRDLKAYGGISIVRSSDELAAEISRSLRDPSYRREGRRAIVAGQCELTDGMSGRRIAEAILSFARNL